MGVNAGWHRTWCSEALRLTAEIDRLQQQADEARRML